MGFPTARHRGVWWLRAGTTECTGTLLFPLQWSSEQVSTLSPSLSILFWVIDSKMLGQFQDSDILTISQAGVLMHYLLGHPNNPKKIEPASIPI